MRPSLGPWADDPFDVAGGDGLLRRRKRGFVIPLGEADCGDGRLIAALHLHLVRASEPLEACEQRARLFLPAAVEKELDYAVHHAADPRGRVEVLVRYLVHSRERFVPAAEHGERVGHLAERRPLSHPVSDPPRELE